MFKKNIQTVLIKKIYFEIKNKFFNSKKLKKRIIFVVINKNIYVINIIYINNLRDEIFLKYNCDKFSNDNMKHEFFNKCFHYYDEISFFSYILRLKIDMLVIFLQNFKFSIKYNDIKTRFIRIKINILKIKILFERNVDIKITKINELLFHIRV